jgi:hypothetical protein
MYICNKVYGCDENTLYGTHKIYKDSNYQKSYNKLLEIHKIVSN